MNDDWEAVDDYWDLSYYVTKRLISTLDGWMVDYCVRTMKKGAISTHYHT